MLNGRRLLREKNISEDRNGMKSRLSSKLQYFIIALIHIYHSSTA